jgi:hypothetical protein
LEQNGKFGGKKKTLDLREKGELKAEGNGERERTNEGATISSHGILFLLVFILPAWNGLARAAAALCCLKRFGEEFQSVLISSCLVQTYLYLSIYLSTSVQYDLAGDSFLSFWLLID